MVPKFTVMECLRARPLRGANLRFVPAGKFDGDAGGDGLRGAWSEDGALERAEIHGGVLIGAVGVAGQHGVGVEFLDANLHGSDLVWHGPCLEHESRALEEVARIYNEVDGQAHRDHHRARRFQNAQRNPSGAGLHGRRRRGVSRFRCPASFPYTRGIHESMYQGQALDHAAILRIRDARGDQIGATFICSARARPGCRWPSICRR